MVQALTRPIIDAQAITHEKLEQEVEYRLNDLTEKVKKLQYAVYQTEDPDTRFHRIYKKLDFLEAARLKDEQKMID